MACSFAARPVAARTANTVGATAAASAVARRRFNRILNLLEVEDVRNRAPQPGHSVGGPQPAASPRWTIGEGARPLAAGADGRRHAVTHTARTAPEVRIATCRAPSTGTVNQAHRPE